MIGGREIMLEMVTVKEAARVLGLSEETVRRKYREGQIRGRPKTEAKGSPILIERASLDEYVKKLEDLGNS